MKIMTNQTIDQIVWIGWTKKHHKNKKRTRQAGSTHIIDTTTIAIATGFVYLAAILDAWSRGSQRGVAQAIDRQQTAPANFSINTPAALGAAISAGSRRRAACIDPTAAQLQSSPIQVAARVDDVPQCLGQRLGLPAPGDPERSRAQFSFLDTIVYSCMTAQMACDTCPLGHQA
jgi:hypothetical protein